jgi:hypothetical protein
MNSQVFLKAFNLLNRTFSPYQRNEMPEAKVEEIFGSTPLICYPDICVIRFELSLLIGNALVVLLNEGFFSLKGRKLDDFWHNT